MKEREVLPLPIKIEEIDREWLTAALRTRAPGATVEHFEIVNVDHGTCTMVRIKLEMDEVGRAAGIPSLVILKGGFEPHSRSMFFEHDRESRWYRDVLPVLELRAPAAYFADVDEERLQGIVIMDDLVARGVRFCDPLVPEGFEQARRCLSSLAAYHAKSWNSPDLEPGGRWDWLDDERDGILPYFEGWGYFEPDNFQRFATSPRGAACSVKFLDVEWVHSSIRKLARVAEDLPRCIVHSDPHLGNLYEDIDGTPGFFDSRPMKMVPYRDMIYYITCALDPADRRRWDGALVQHYLDELARNGVVAPGFDEMMFYFSIFLVHGFLIFLENPSHYQPEAVNTAFAARFSAAMIDHRTREMLETIP
jgi:hypothetical protein